MMDDNSDMRDWDTGLVSGHTPVISSSGGCSRASLADQKPVLIMPTHRNTEFLTLPVCQSQYVGHKHVLRVELVVVGGLDTDLAIGDKTLHDGDDADAAATPQHSNY